MTRALVGVAPALPTSAARLGDIPVSAAPSAQVGMSAIAGGANTWMRSDAAPAINPGIAPTWTALHTFSAGLAATDVSLTGTGSLLQVGSTKYGWASSQYAIDLGQGGSIHGDAYASAILDNNLYYGGSGPGWLYKTTAAAAQFSVLNGGFTWSTAPSGNAGAAATLSGVMTLNAGVLSVGGGVQAVGYAVAAGIGVELGYTGGMGYLNAYNHTSSVYLPLTIACTTLALSQLATSTTAPAAGGAGALPATPAGYMAVTIAGTARRIPYYT